MSGSINKAIIVGNLGADPDVRSIASGSRVANISVATSRRWTDRSGQQQEKTEWHRIVLWEKLADIATGIFAGDALIRVPEVVGELSKIFEGVFKRGASGAKTPSVLSGADDEIDKLFQ